MEVDKVSGFKKTPPTYFMNEEQRKIKTPELNSFSRWPEKPYQWMMEGLVHTIQNVDGSYANYLVALGLVCYTEVVGREIRKFKKLPFGARYNKECFNTFLGDYMNYQDLLVSHPNLYRWYRHGLCHEFKIKNVGTRESGVFHFFTGNKKEEKIIKKFFNADVTRGIVIGSNGKKLLFLENYLRDFAKGIEKFLKESKQIV